MIVAGVAKAGGRPDQDPFNLFGFSTTKQLGHPHPPYTLALLVTNFYPLPPPPSLSLFLISSSRWCACQYSPIVLKPFPTLRSVDEDKFWFVLHPRSLSSSFDACNSMVSLHTLYALLLLDLMKEAWRKNVVSARLSFEGVAAAARTRHFVCFPQDYV